MDSNCKYELNRQLQGLEARVGQCERNIVAQYQATSALAIATATEVTAVLPLATGILNGIPAAFQAMVSALSNPDAFVAIIMQILLSQLGIPSLAQLVNQATGLIESRVAELNAQLQDLIAHNAAVEEIRAVEAELAKFKNALDSATSFFSAQNNLSACRTAAHKIGGF